MAAYEVIAIFSPQLDEESLEKAITRFEEVIKNGGGEITKADRWGKRRLAYEVKGFTEGYYVYMEIAAPSALVSELDRLYRIADEVIRHLIVKANT